MELKPQFIKTTGGEELVVLTRAEFDALRRAAEGEDEDDIVIFDARMAELKDGRDRALPSEVSDHVLKGDSPIRAFRKWRGLTQAELSSRTGIAQGYISDIETGQKNGTADAMRSIAVALDVDGQWFWPPA